MASLELNSLLAEAQGPGAVNQSVPSPLTVTAICKRCGAEFSYQRGVNGAGRRATCSEECRRARVGRPPVGTLLKQTCKQCGGEFTYVLHGRGATRRYCSQACVDAARRVRPSKRHRPYIAAPSEVSVSCCVCGIQFSYERTGKGRNRVTCSDECREARTSGKRLAWSRIARIEGRYLEKDRARWRAIIGQRHCVICGASFPIRKANPDTVTCGIMCGGILAIRRAKEAGTYVPPKKIWPDRASMIFHRNSRRRLILRAATTVPPEKISRMDIFQRDGWRCGLCHKKVNPKLQWPDPRCAVIDHIIPITKGGPHIAANLQCAHFSCNSRKQDGIGGQLRLFG